ncbi:MULTISPECIES: hypothetical protein [Rhodococcus]|uniref:hypothetical protein n=1 Tax=Rhodococcus TaxID=1827 RepID=UPI0007AEBDFC|nr:MULTISPECIES: hypothetical protein [Rhodococcus]ARE36544.1 hypothetical protein A0W34_27075 [Rhodococcus sp. BH4]KZL32897.1 hypothetical protein A3852_11210 [Rhodococcus qingshengii]MBQ9054727.1 hypothetical protein [Rhodococcus sp. (in: high G+C Gram-positive bacteria)]MCE4161986.1 hypothetical protein [Rhodococcus sp. Ni2]WNF41425.1 hypothetical protein RHP72_27230 [Rhodococcus sp. SG20037]
MDQAVSNSQATRRSGALRWVVLVNALIAASASAMYVAAKCHLTWPEPADSALSIAGAVVLWVLTASVAIVLLGVCWWQRRPWLWSDVAVPVLVVIALGIAAAGQPHFDQYRADFETVAQQLLQEPDDPYSDGYHRDLRIGRFDISYANVSSEAHVYFYDARDGLDILDNPGWVYAPDGVSDKTFNQLRLEDIGGGWYRFPHLVVDSY